VSPQNITFTQNFKMKILLIVLSAFLLLFSCKQEQQVDYFEGVLIYECDDAMLNNVPVDSGKFIKYFVKGDSVRVESFTSVGKQIHLRDHQSNSGALIFVYGGKKIALLQDFNQDTIKRNFTFKTSSEIEEIAGITSNKAQVSGAFLDAPIDVYYSSNYPKHILEIYDGIIPGLPTKYQLMVQQIPVNYTLVKLEQKAIDTKKFAIPDDCIVLTMEEFLELLSTEDFIQ
jgi:hypothetical protein